MIGLFVDEFFIYRRLERILESGQVPVAEPIFAEFNDYLRSLGLDVFTVDYRIRAKEVFGEPSVITIYLKTTANMIENEIDPQRHTWGHAHEYTTGISDHWKALIRKHGFPESYVAETIWVDFYSFEDLYLSFLPGSCKVEVTHFLDSLSEGSRPKYVFSSSEPAFNIVYATQKAFAENLGRGRFDEIRDGCNRVLSSHDLFGYFRPGAVRIHFYHCEDKSVNLYGLSRED